MGLLKAQVLFDKLNEMAQDGYDLSKINVFIGDDEELNGVHEAFYAQSVTVNNPDDNEYVDMINEIAFTRPYVDKDNPVAILIS